MASTNQRRLRQQTWLLAGLVATMALSGFFLWRLRVDDPRPGRAVRAGDAAPRADEPPMRPENSVAASPGKTEERVELPPERGTSAPAVSADAFEADALYGRTLVDGVPEPGVRVFVFTDELAARDTRTPVGEAQSDAEGRFRLRALAPHRRYTVLAQSDAVLPHQEVLFPGEPQELELTRAVAIGGTVRARGNGQALAEVEIACARQHWDGKRLAERISARSAADGTWRLPWVEVGLPTLLILRPGRTTE
ncbi:MAG: hypothetical protein ABL998_16865, partial [Planctomycetota bacterium]